MPDNGKYDDDDYVAKLLAEDAKKSSQRYAAVGLSALLPKRATNVAPKPNTRFLNHLVREVDSHNAALKRKEEVEAKIRLREMSRQANRSRDGRRDIDDDGRERKRRRTNESDYGRLRYQEHEEPAEQRRSMSPRDERKHRDEKRRRTSHRSERDDHERREHRNETRRENPHGKREERRTRERSRRIRSITPERSSRHHNRPDRAHKHERQRSKTPPNNNHDDDSESDPLSELIGPKPVPRGRGHKQTIRSRSNIDAHFSSTYDPSLDVHPESDGDKEGRGEEQEDWDMALEALRDRTMWKRKQSERLREAGFGEDEIRKWEVTARVGGVEGAEGADRDVRDVRWKREGEAREWDVGKEGVT